MKMKTCSSQTSQGNLLWRNLHKFNEHFAHSDNCDVTYILKRDVFCCFWTVHEHRSITIALGLNLYKAMQHGPNISQAFSQKHETFATQFSVFRSTMVWVTLLYRVMLKTIDKGRSEVAATFSHFLWLEFFWRSLRFMNKQIFTQHMQKLERQNFVKYFVSFF